MSQRRSAPSTASEAALSLIAGVLEGFRLHPAFIILSTRAEPPLEHFAHQQELLGRLQLRRPVRVLIGDEIGLGKTIEAILAARLVSGEDGRVLLLVPRILVRQWIGELRRFNIRANQLESKNIGYYERLRWPPGWYVASIDLVKLGRHKPRITSVPWDVVIVDEAHRVGSSTWSGSRRTLRFALVEELADVRSRSIILLSATPHRGSQYDYLSRLRLVDPYLDNMKDLDRDDFYRATIPAIVIRRTKQDVNEYYEGRKIFTDARFIAYIAEATSLEKEFMEGVFSFLRAKIRDYEAITGETQRALGLLLTLIAKRAASSPRAAAKTLLRVIESRASRVQEEAALRILDRFWGLLGESFEDYEEAGLDSDPEDIIEEATGIYGLYITEDDIASLRRIISIAREIERGSDSRIRSLLKIINKHLVVGESIVVFTEYRDTAEYIYERIARESPELARYTALVTGRGVTLPGSRPNTATIEDLKEALRYGRVKIIVSTDVASEGLNLQAANVLVNYELTWSPVKIEQRIGRVWRLGQKRTVYAYTILLAIDVDQAVLETIYEKLLAWGRSMKYSKVPIGERIVIDMLSSNSPSYPALPVTRASGGKEETFSEYRAILTYLRGGRRALNKYVEEITSALEALRRELEKVGLARRRMIEIEVRNALDKGLGGLRGDALRSALEGLFSSTARLKGLTVREKAGKLMAGRYFASTSSELYQYTRDMAGDPAGTPLVFMTTGTDYEGELHLYKVILSLEGEDVYSETIGILVTSDGEKILRGSKLLDLLSTALSGESLAMATEYASTSENKEYRHRAEQHVFNNVIGSLVKNYVDYITHTERTRLANVHTAWRPRSEGDYNVRSEWIGTLIIGKKTNGTGTPTPAFRREVELRAMQYAMEYERRKGREPIDVSATEHYDILSRDPKTGEIRFIEVKGHAGFDLAVILSEAEFEFGKKNKERYWLYIVYNVMTDKPGLVVIHNPIENMKVEVISERKYRLSP